jgi:hypothetical protein
MISIIAGISSPSKGISYNLCLGERRGINLRVQNAETNPTLALA